MTETIPYSFEITFYTNGWILKRLFINYNDVVDNSDEYWKIILKKRKHELYDNNNT